MELLSDPRFQLGLAAAVLLVVVFLLWRRKGKSSRPARRDQDPQLQRLIDSGSYEGAARYQHQRGHYQEAFDLYLQAQLPRKAADMAMRLERPREAAELYERAGELRKASRAYREAGMAQQASKLAQLASQEDAGTISPGAAPPPDEFDAMMTPTRQADTLELEFQQLRRKADEDDPEARDQLMVLGREAAEVLLAAGHMERAAEVCRDAGLIDQAVNLYVNLLGRPGEAAVLLARKGEHQRAAELFEAAGEKQRSLACWIDCSQDAEDPLEHLPEVEQRLGQEAAITLLDSIARKRPPSSDNIELHYRLAGEYEQRSQGGTAITVLQAVDRIRPEYLDVRQRLDKLRIGNPSVPKPPWEREPDEEPAIDLNASALSDADSDALLSQLEPDGWDGELSCGLNLDEDEAALEEVPLADVRVPGIPQLDSIEPLETSGPGTSPTLRASSAARALGLERDRPAGLPDLLKGPSVEDLVNRAAHKAAEEAVARARSEVIMVDAGGGAPTVQVSGQTRPMRLGFEEKIVTLRFSRDHAVREAVSGSELERLSAQLVGKEPMAGNVEHFFRLGLGMVNAGRWLEAQEVFEAIHSARPGYLDAGDRAQELDKWQVAVNNTVAAQGPGGSQLLDRYQLLGEIGRGGMAVVYRAKDLSLDREVALKFLAESMTEDPRMSDLFQREAKAAAALNHPNIVTIYDFGTLGDRAFICMELVGGETVEEIIIRDSRLATLDALAVAEDILRALEYAHSQQIIHRDIKPSNVMRNERGECKLMDFGLAKSVSGGAKTTMVAGTPIYMAPEQFTGRDVDARSDIFALGATLYEMISGQPPFESMARDKKPTPLREAFPKVPAMLDRLVMRALEFDQDKRIQTAKQMLEPVQYILSTVRAYLRTSARPSAPPVGRPLSAASKAPGGGKVTRALGSKGGID